MTIDASAPRIPLLRTIAADLHRRLDNANRVLRSAMTVEDKAREDRIGLSLSDLGVALLAIEALEIELARVPQPIPAVPIDPGQQSISFARDPDRTPPIGHYIHG